VTIPAVEGEPRNATRDALRKLGLKVSEREESSDTVGENRVIESIPSQGERVDKGSTVTLVISTGPERETVPDVVGRDRDQAESTLEDAGFKVSVTEKEDADKDPGTVLSQDPAGGTTVKKGARVTLTVPLEPQPSDNGDPAHTPPKPASDAAAPDPSPGEIRLDGFTPSGDNAAGPTLLPHPKGPDYESTIGRRPPHRSRRSQKSSPKSA